MALTDVPFAQLEALLAVARSKSFTAAARERGVSRSAISQAIQQLEARLGVALVQRTTRSLALTDAGRALVEGVAPAFAQTEAALVQASARPGEVVGRLKLSVPRSAVARVIEPLLPIFRERHPRIELEIAVEDRFVDIVAGGYDAGVRLSESIERDMTQVRLTPPFRFVVVGAPSYFAARGRPRRPEDLLAHECLTFRSQNTGALYAWELERGRKSWRVPVRGSIVTNDPHLCTSLARGGLGLAYSSEPRVRAALRSGSLEVVLEEYAPMVPGFYLYFPTRTKQPPPLRLFIEAARDALER